MLAGAGYGEVRGSWLERGVDEWGATESGEKTGLEICREKGVTGKVLKMGR